jgi:hypothetical protein
MWVAWGIILVQGSRGLALSRNSLSLYGNEISWLLKSSVLEWQPFD